MTAAPLIGLTGRRKSASKIEGTAGNLQHLDGDWYYADYARGILQAGGLPVHLPMDVDPRRFVDRLDGVILTGGSDVGPAHYGAVNEFEEHNHVESDRDELELTLYAGAIAAGLPVLGICRGLQVINVGGGGTLHQHVPEHSRYDIAAHETPHPVELSPGSALAAMYGDSYWVNSLHHQTVDRLAEGYMVTATHKDTVEGMEHATLPVLAVQWHPELMTSRDTDPVFRWLVDQAIAYTT